MTSNSPVEFPHPILNIAHRGARAFAPENTLPAFAKAHTFGCRMIELDVHLSMDNEIIVYHDDHLTHCTDAVSKFPDRSSYFISDFTYEEISMLDAGSWFAKELAMSAEKRQWYLQDLTPEEIALYITFEELASFASGSIKVPTLRQALDLAQNLGMEVNIELKMLPRMYPGLTMEVVDLIEDMKMQDSVLISSFDHTQLLDARRRSPKIATAVLTNERLAQPDEYLRLIDAQALHPGTDTLGLASIAHALDAYSIDAVRKVGKCVNVWTCNNKDEMRQLIAAGVTGLISDYPNRVRDVLEELDSSSS